MYPPEERQAHEHEHLLQRAQPVGSGQTERRGDATLIGFMLMAISGALCGFGGGWLMFGAAAGPAEVRQADTEELRRLGFMRASDIENCVRRLASDIRS